MFFYGLAIFYRPRAYQGFLKGSGNTYTMVWPFSS